MEFHLSQKNSAAAIFVAGKQKKRSRRPRVNLWVGSHVTGLLILVAIFAPLIVTVDPVAIFPEARLLPPSALHWMGTDAFGRDLFSRVVYGSRLAIRLSLGAVLVAAIPGTVLGLLAGYFRGWVDQVLSRLMDGWMAMPGLLLALVLIARTGASFDAAILALGLTGIAGYFRLVRGGAISLSQQLYMEAGRALGAGWSRQIFVHLLPNLASSLVVWTTLRMGTFLLAGSSLSFIGLGAQPPQPEWGAILAEGRDYLDTAWWYFVFPLLGICVSTIGFNLMGDGLSDLLSGRR
jgi:ABC-type dipeptide/oligopeptide/nickel transport system permease subunit